MRPSRARPSIPDWRRPCRDRASCRGVGRPLRLRSGAPVRAGLVGCRGGGSAPRTPRRRRCAALHAGSVQRAPPTGPGSARPFGRPREASGVGRAGDRPCWARTASGTGATRGTAVLRGGGIRHPARELSRPAPLAQTEQEHATLGRLGTRVRCGGTCVAPPTEAENVAATSPTATQMTSASGPPRVSPSAASIAISRCALHFPPRRERGREARSRGQPRRGRTPHRVALEARRVRPRAGCGPPRNGPATSVTQRS